MHRRRQLRLIHEAEKADSLSHSQSRCLRLELPAQRTFPQLPAARPQAQL
jgi:hypothetical protein